METKEVLERALEMVCQIIAFQPTSNIPCPYEECPYDDDYSQQKDCRGCYMDYYLKLAKAEVENDKKK